MIGHLTRKLISILLCATIYSLTLASTDPIDFGTGAVLGMGMLWLTRNFMHDSRIRSSETTLPAWWRRVLWAPVFIGAIMWDILTSTFGVMLYSLRLRPIEHEGIVAIPIGERTKAGVAIFAWASSLSPGSALVDIDWHAGQMLYHVMDARDPDQVRANYQRFYERFQRPVFP